MELANIQIVSVLLSSVAGFLFGILAGVSVRYSYKGLEEKA